MDITIRAVRPEEYEVLGDLTGFTYLGDGLLLHGEDDYYLAVLRDTARRAREAEVLVAVDAEGRIVGGVTFAPGGTPWADVAVPGEAEFRMLVVAPDARGQGVGEALVQACVDRARALPGCRRLVLSTSEIMAAARRIYERTGFVRTPARDWEPVPGHVLPTYALEF